MVNMEKGLEINEWTKDLNNFIKEMAVKYHQKSLMHNFQASKCHINSWWCKFIIIICVAVIELIQLITIIDKGDKAKIIISITTMVIIVFVGIILQYSYLNQYDIKETLHAKTSADYELVYQNILITLSHPYDKREPGMAYSTYINNTYIRLIGHELFIPPKVEEKYENIEVIIEENDQKEISCKTGDEKEIDSKIIKLRRAKTISSKRTLDEIESRVKDTELSPYDSYQMHRFIHNL